jgi:hypothetical protein
MHCPSSSMLIPLSRPLFSRHTPHQLSAVDMHSTRIYRTFRILELVILQLYSVCLEPNSNKLLGLFLLRRCIFLQVMGPVRSL